MSKLRHIKRIPALVISFAVALSLTAVAIGADNLIVDGDTLTEFNDSDMIFAGTVPCNVDTTRNARLALRHQGGGQVFDNGSTVTVSAQSSHPAVSAATTTISLPSNWESSTNGTLSNIVSSLVTVHPTSPGPVNASLTFLATGPEGGTSTGSITRSNAMDVSYTAGSCDTTAPESTATAKNADNSTYTFGDWTKQNVTVTLAATDAGSGVKEIRYTTDGTDPTASTGTVYSTPFPVNTEGTTTIKWRAIDNAGNVEAVRSAAVRIDKTAPSVSCDTADGAWHATDVSIACTAADTGGSGVAPATDESFSLHTEVPAGTETDAAETNSKTVSDAAGNTATAGPVGGNRVDKKGPAVDCDEADGAWHGSDVSIACTATDGGSGVNPATDESFSLHTEVPDGTETANASTDSKTVSDAVGNTNTAGPIAGNKVDKKAPTVWCGSADGNWHASDVSIGCTAADGGSGVNPATDESFSLHTEVPDGTETVNALTNGRNVADAVGNTAVVGAIGGNKVDKKAPGVLCGSADGNWHATDVSIACTANDGGSGLAATSPGSFSLSTSVPAGTQTDNAETNSRTVSDAVGNGKTAGPVGGNKVDKKGPVVTLTCPTGALRVGATATASWSASDGSGSGVVAPTSGSVALNTATVGGHTAATAAGTATDNVGNPSLLSTCNYSVEFDFTGFFQPIDNGGIFNKAKAGSAIPVKFSLDGAPRPGSNTPGLAGAGSAFAPSTPSAPNPLAAVVACPSSAALFDILEELADTTSGLKYDPAADQWVYVWKTTTSLANSCRQLKVTLADGTTKTANFNFTK